MDLKDFFEQKKWLLLSISVILVVIVSLVAVIIISKSYEDPMYETTETYGELMTGLMNNKELENW